MKCKQILLNMRAERNKEIKKYNSFLKSSFDCTKKGVKTTLTASDGNHDKSTSKNNGNVSIASVNTFQNLSDKRKSILRLELPFKTDTVSINRTIVDSFPENLPKDYRDAYEWAETSFPYKENRRDCSVGSDNLLKRDYMINLFSSKMWPTIKKIDFDEEGNSSESIEPASLEDFVQNKIRTSFFDNIKALPLKESSIKIYLCYGRKILEHRRYEGACSNMLSISGISAKTLAEYFEYLESRCLKKGTKEAYQDLIEIRLLFYIPLPTKELKTITAESIDTEKQGVNVGKNFFSLPTPFIALALSLFSQKDPLFRRDVKQLNKFVEQTTNAIKLKWITPKLIRRSMPFICRQEQFISENLPRR